MPDPNEVSRYRRALQEARELAFALTRDQEERLLSLVAAWAEEMAGSLAEGVGTIDERIALELALETLDAMAADMQGETFDGVQTTIDVMREIHSEATSRLLATEGRAGVGVGFGGPSLEAATTVLARPELAEAFVTVRDAAVERANEAIVEAILRGHDPRQLAMRLRTMMVGAEALPDRLLDDRRRISYDALIEMGLEPTRENLERIRREAATVAHRASRIARTETMVAEHEAAARMAQASPVVAALRWTLSTRHEVFDVCDILAGETGDDFYGLGAGVYPPDLMPLRPHPHCMCGRQHVLRPVEEWGEPRDPAPALQLDPSEVALGEGLPPSSQEMLDESVRAPTFAGGLRSFVSLSGDPDTLTVTSSVIEEEGSVSWELPPGVRDEIIVWESENLDAKVEHLLVFDRDGNVVLRRTDNHPHQVGYGGKIDMIRNVDGGIILVHNHPGLNSDTSLVGLSPGDLLQLDERGAAAAEVMNVFDLRSFEHVDALAARYRMKWEGGHDHPMSERFLGEDAAASITGIWHSFWFAPNPLSVRETIERSGVGDRIADEAREALLSADIDIFEYDGGSGLDGQPELRELWKLLRNMQVSRDWLTRVARSTDLAFRAEVE